MRLNIKTLIGKRKAKYSEIIIFSKYLDLRTDNDPVSGNYCFKALSLVVAMYTYDLLHSRI
jgi:hypothetical protein